MRSIAKISMVALILVSGCAIDEKRTEIMVSNSGFKIDGEIYSSRTSFANALISKKITRVHFVPDTDAGYKQMEAALEAAQEAGITDIGLIGNLNREE